MNRDFKGVWIPRDIWLSKELSMIEKVLLVEIDSLDNDPEKGCFASDEYLGEFVGRDPGTVSNILTKLRKKGYLKRVYWNGRQRGLRLVSRNHESSFHVEMKADLTKSCEQLSRNRESRLHENVNILIQDNNTVNNTEVVVVNDDEAFTNEGEEITVVEIKTEEEFLPLHENDVKKLAPPTGLDQWVEQLKSDPLLAENLQVAYKVNATEALKNFDKFLAQQKLAGKSYWRYSDFRSHFCRWAAQQQDHSQREKSKTGKQKQDLLRFDRNRKPTKDWRNG